ncbi:hypothetical protein Aph01nite_77010 [Acrocarpospora phusangensis]|uniref:Uncharacterized protein n=1 Tax=Acrocarpospora phusangensis TaxID=1070424 RepID=A0A919QKD4_9ACTN|nr:hypothetical protein Aph01nite_77010 [Acrocarpospora phusangensis]
MSSMPMHEVNTYAPGSSRNCNSSQVGTAATTTAAIHTSSADFDNRGEPDTKILSHLSAGYLTGFDMERRRGGFAQMWQGGVSGTEDREPHSGDAPERGPPDVWCM